MPPQPSLAPQLLPVQSGVQQLPETQVSPEAHLQVPPHPFEPHDPVGQLGVQQLFATQLSPEAQAQVPPQPLGPQDPVAQTGVQQPYPASVEATQNSPLVQPPLQTPPQPSGSPQLLPVQSGAQQPPSTHVAPLEQPHLPPQPLLPPQLPDVQLGVQQEPLPPSKTHCWPAAQPVLQVPPQPSLCPQLWLPQLGWQQLPLVHTPPSAHLQVPPQPSEPQLPEAQWGLQTQLPYWQVPASQG